MVDATHGAEQKIPDRRRWYSVLYVQVLLAIVFGAIVGYAAPDTGKALKPLGDAFIQLIKMMIAPVIFCTVVHGIASMGDLHKVGRVGVKTLGYFEVVSTIALAIGLFVGEIIRPGARLQHRSRDARHQGGRGLRHPGAQQEGIVSHLLAIIPNSYFDALARGDLLQVLLVSILTGFAIARMGDAAARRSSLRSTLPHACSSG